MGAIKYKEIGGIAHELSAAGPRMMFKSQKPGGQVVAGESGEAVVIRKDEEGKLVVHMPTAPIAKWAGKGFVPASMAEVQKAYVAGITKGDDAPSETDAKKAFAAMASYEPKAEEPKGK